MSAPRIVSLLPSATEIVAALGFADALVGRSHECDFPAEVSELPVCTEPRIDPGGSSEEIHRSVGRLLSESLSVYLVDADRLRDLSPTHVVTQVQCEVCAVSLEDVERALAGWSSARPCLVALTPGCREDVFGDVRRVARALGASDRGERLVTGMEERMTRVASAAGSLERPRVATIEWLSPLMAAGNWMPELVERAGGREILGRAGRHSEWLTWDTLRGADPDVLVVAPCGFSLGRVEREVEVLTALPGWSELAAVRSKRVCLAEANQYFNRPGPRLVETVEILAEMLHPGAFAFGHEGTAWRLQGSLKSVGSGAAG